MKHFFQLADRLGKQQQAPHTAWIFRQALFLFIAVYTILLLPIADQIWGPDAYMLRYDPGIHPFFRAVGLLLYESAEGLYLWVAGLLIAITLVGMLRVVPLLTAILVYYFTHVLFLRGVELATGGHHLLLLELTFIVFMSFSTSVGTQPGKFQWAKNTIANLARYAVQVQIAIMYLFSGINKLMGEVWESGEAMFYVMSIPEFSHPIAMDLAPQLHGLLVVLNYLVLGYQFVFPTLVWFKKLRPWVLFFGLGFHLAIVFVVGIVDFGVIMVLSYLIFLPNERAKRWLSLIGRLFPLSFRKWISPPAPGAAAGPE